MIYKTAMRLSVLSVALVVTIGCAYIGRAGNGAEGTTSPEVSTRPQSDDGDGTPEFTDPPLPTFDDKSPRPHESNADWAIPDCVDWNWQVDAITGLRPLSRIAATIVLGEFEGYSSSRWNTPNGERPASDEYHDSSYDITIVRDIDVQLESAMRGDEAGLDGAYVRGGELGCDRIAYSQIPELEAGSSMVFFINPGPIGDADSEVLPELIRAWPVDQNGFATGDSGELISLDEIRETVASTEYAPADPSGD